MPNVTSTGSRSASANARSRSEVKAAVSSIAWSAHITANAASPGTQAAAAAMAGAVLRWTGSPTTVAPGHSRTTSRTRSAAVMTMTWSAGTRVRARSKVAASSVRPPPASGSSCLGRSGRLQGQNRSPRPPATTST